MSFDLVSVLRRAKNAAPVLASLNTQQRNLALSAIRTALLESSADILEANAVDVAAARDNGMSEGLLDRLTLTRGRIEGICDGISQLVSAPDPLNSVKSGHVAENGLKIIKITVPIGVIAVVFEARPNVGPDVAALCLKSGNVCVLRGGKEAVNSNRALADTMRGALERAGFCPDFINPIDSTDRSVTAALLKSDEYLDCVIPRGGAGLIRAVRTGSTVPVIETGAGICHIYVDKSADPEKAIRITDNAKTSRPGVCNAAECLLIHSEVAADLLPGIKQALDAHSVQLRCCPRSLEILHGGKNVIAATEADYDTEFGAMIMSVRVVDSLEQAMQHIALHSTHHSEAIISEDYSACERFLASVDSAAVYANASTRFTDGGCFGLGAEIGISTQKLHARGPMGLGELVSTKYTVYGDGQIR